MNSADVSSCGVRCVMTLLSDGARIAIPVDDIQAVIESPVEAVPPCVGRGIAGVVAVVSDTGEPEYVPVVRLGASMGPCVILRCAPGSWAVQVAHAERAVSVRPTRSSDDWFIDGMAADGHVRILDSAALAASFSQAS